ncbi:MAG: PKD domain-containing protein [Bacteroidetes bacterium]|nr:PKD domain-containing protein [Bacteroidota bacterium]
MKKYLLFLFTLLVFISCDKRKDFGETLNKTPEVQVAPADSFFYTFSATRRDSIKTTKVNSASYFFKISDEDEKIEPIVEFPTTAISYSIDYSQSKITFFGFQLGNYDAVITAVDKYGVEASPARINFESFVNKNPIASLNYFILGILDPREYILNGQFSFDPDVRFGGGIVEYTFKVGSSYTVVTPNPSIKYIFPSAGTYPISLQVKDNDNSTSVWINTTAVIP